MVNFREQLPEEFEVLLAKQALGEITAEEKIQLGAYLQTEPLLGAEVRINEETMQKLQAEKRSRTDVCLPADKKKQLFKLSQTVKKQPSLLLTFIAVAAMAFVSFFVLLTLYDNYQDKNKQMLETAVQEEYTDSKGKVLDSAGSSSVTSSQQSEKVVTEKNNALMESPIKKRQQQNLDSYEEDVIQKEPSKLKNAQKMMKVKEDILIQGVDEKGKLDSLNEDILVHDSATIDTRTEKKVTDNSIVLNEGKEQNEKLGLSLKTDDREELQNNEVKPTPSATGLRVAKSDLAKKPLLEEGSKDLVSKNEDAHIVPEPQIYRIYFLGKTYDCRVMVSSESIFKENISFEQLLKKSNMIFSEDGARAVKETDARKEIFFQSVQEVSTAQLFTSEEESKEIMSMKELSLLYVVLGEYEKAKKLTLEEQKVVFSEVYKVLSSLKFIQKDPVLEKLLKSLKM